MDEAAKFAHAETEGMKRGMEKGRKEGVQQGKIQMIKSMHALGIPLETIAKTSKLSAHEVEHILGHK